MTSCNKYRNSLVKNVFNNTKLHFLPNKIFIPFLRYQKHKLHYSSPVLFPIININQTYKITRYIIIYNENNLKFSLKQKITKFSLKNTKILSVEYRFLN